MSDLESLDGDLRELFSLEKDAYVEDVAARDAVLRRLQAAIVLAPLAVGAGAAAGAGAGAAGAGTGAGAGAKAAGLASLGWKSVAVVGAMAFGAGVGVGEAHHSLTGGASVAPVTAQPSPAVIPARSLVASEKPEPTTITPSSLPTVPPVVSAVPVVPAPAVNPTVDVQAERSLIDTARTALGRGMAADALSAIDAHAKRFPHGRLAEEREALAVQALVAKGDAVAARARASRFRKTFPDSIFRAAVDSAIASLDGR